MNFYSLFIFIFHGCCNDTKSHHNVNVGKDGGQRSAEKPHAPRRRHTLGSLSFSWWPPCLMGHRVGQGLTQYDQWSHSSLDDKTFYLYHHQPKVFCNFMWKCEVHVRFIICVRENQTKRFTAVNRSNSWMTLMGDTAWLSTVTGSIAVIPSDGGRLPPCPTTTPCSSGLSYLRRLPALSPLRGEDALHPHPPSTLFPSLFCSLSHSSFLSLSLLLCC